MTNTTPAVVAERLLSISQAAERTPFSADTIRRAIRATDPDVFPPPLRAKRGARGQYLVLESELTRWMHGLADA